MTSGREEMEGLQWIAATLLQCGRVGSSVVQGVGVCWSVLEMCCSVLKVYFGSNCIAAAMDPKCEVHAATHCMRNTLHRIATHYNTLHHTATHCNCNTL